VAVAVTEHRTACLPAGPHGTPCPRRRHVLAAASPSTRRAVSRHRLPCGAGPPAAAAERARGVLRGSPLHRLPDLPMDGAGGVQEGGWPGRRCGAAQLPGGEDQGPAGFALLPNILNPHR